MNTFCDSRLKKLWDKILTYPVQIPKLIIYSFHISRRPCGNIRPILALVVAGHTFCLSKFLTQACYNMPMRYLSGYSLKTPLGIAGEILAKKHCKIYTLSHTQKTSLKAVNFISLLISEEDKCQDVCLDVSGKQKENFFTSRICFISDHQGQRESNRFTVSVANAIWRRSVFAESSVNYQIIE